MGSSRWLGDSPRFTRPDYKTYYRDPCVREEDFGKTWYRGTGIVRSEHPLADRLSFSTCDGCESRDVLVIAAQRSVHPMSGDLYYDYELECCRCGRFTARSFAGND